MIVTMTRFWWLSVLRGVIFILFGVAALLWPGIAFATLVLLFGAFAFASGIIAVWTAFSLRSREEKWAAFFLQGLLGIAFGVLALMWPFATAGAIILVIAAWALLAGLIELAAALRLRREMEDEWMLMVSGTLSILLGLLFALFPAAGIWTVTWLIAVFAILAGLAMIQLGFRLRRRGTGTA